MKKHIRCCLFTALITATLFTPSYTVAESYGNDGINITKLCLVGGGLIASFFGGKWIYDTFVREKTDTEELLATEILYNEVYHGHNNIVLQYDQELRLICNVAHEPTCFILTALKQTIYRTKKGYRYPFIEYNRALDAVINTIDRNQKKFMNRKNLLLARKLALHKTQAPLSAEEHAYLENEYTSWYEKISRFDGKLMETLDTLWRLKHYVTASEEYAQEMLLARLDYLENRINILNQRPTTHIVYVNNTHHSADLTQRLDNIEQQIQAGQTHDPSAHLSTATNLARFK